MSAQTSFIKYLQIALIFLYMELLLWSALLRPVLDIDVRWIPKTFFSSTKQTTCIIRMHYSPMALLETTFFTALAMFGYFCGCGGAWAAQTMAVWRVADDGEDDGNGNGNGGDGDCGCGGGGIYGNTLANFEQAMMGIRQKLYWICFVPWIITFAQNWLHNVAEFLLLMFSTSSIYDAHNTYTALLLLLLFFVVQASLASEPVYMALQGWCAMRNINAENVEWEKRKRQFDGDTLTTVFGLVH